MKQTNSELLKKCEERERRITQLEAGLSEKSDELSGAEQVKAG